MTYKLKKKRTRAKGEKKADGKHRKECIAISKTGMSIRMKPARSIALEMKFKKTWKGQKVWRGSPTQRGEGEGKIRVLKKVEKRSNKGNSEANRRRGRRTTKFMYANASSII